MKIKTSELIGAQLDWAVAKCEGVEVRIDQKHKDLWIDGGPLDDHDTFYAPSSVWEQGGPIIERERISIDQCFSFGRSGTMDVYASIPNPHGGVLGEQLAAIGPTPLIAAMRVYVASKLGGDEVDVPEELV